MIEWHLQKKWNVVCCRQRHTQPQMALGRLWPCGFSASGLSSPWRWFRHPLHSAQAAGSVPLSALLQALLLRNTPMGAPPQPQSCRRHIPGLGPPAARDRCPDLASPSPCRKAQAGSAFAAIRTSQGNVVFKLTKTCPCSR